MGSLLLLRDVTERQAVEQALVANELRFQQLAQHVDEGFWILSALGERFVYLSPALERILGCPRELLYRRPETWLERVVDSDRSALREARRRLLNGGAEAVGFDETYRIQLPDGRIRWLRDRGAPVVDGQGKVYRVAGAVTDVTQLQEAQAELLARTEALVASNEALADFAQVASHDMQEPLRMVSSYTQILREEYQAQLDEHGREYLDFAHDGALRMQRMVKDLLAYSKISGLQFERVPVDLNAVVARAQSDLLALFAETGAEVQVQPDLPWVLGQSGLLERLITNLLSNAAKFLGQDGSSVELTAEVLGPDVLLEVRDDGIGIDPQQLDRIFRPFDRLHGPDVPGSGMGLAIARRIVEAHGGTIEARVSEGRGSVFQVRLASAQSPV